MSEIWYHNASPYPFERKTADAVGHDLYAFNSGEIHDINPGFQYCRDVVVHSSGIELRPMMRVKIPTGLAFAIPRGLHGEVRPRSSTTDRGLVVPVGTVDPDYRGQVFVTVLNLSESVQLIRWGDRIAQLVFVPVVIPTPVEYVDRTFLLPGSYDPPLLRRVENRCELGETARGARGFGSTGQ